MRQLHLAHTSACRKYATFAIRGLTTWNISGYCTCLDFHHSPNLLTRFLFTFVSEKKWDTLPGLVFLVVDECPFVSASDWDCVCSSATVNSNIWSFTAASLVSFLSDLGTKESRSLKRWSRKTAAQSKFVVFPEYARKCSQIRRTTYFLLLTAPFHRNETRSTSTLCFY